MTKFGFVGTIICFIMYSAMFYGAIQAGWVTKWDEAAGTQVPLQLGMFEILTIGALLCSSDVTAATSTVYSEEQPQLSSII